MRLDPKEHDWLVGPVSDIFKALPKGSTRFVGGCVRNALLGAPIGDVDLATQLQPDEVIAALKKAEIKYVPTGIDHGTLTAVINSVPYEITSLRKDVETDGRRAIVAFTKDWAEDAQRRDLTINALYSSPDGEVFDPCGQGLVDIDNLRLRFVGDADLRIKEDYLRILRFFRFLAWYGGEGVVDAEALRACRENRAGLKSLSSERVWTEMKKLLSAPDPSRAIRIMQTNEVLETIFPEASNSEGLDLMVKLEKAEKLAPDYMLRLMAMSARDEFAMAGFCKRLKVSNLEKARLLSWASNQVGFSPEMTERDLKIGTYASTPQTAYDRMMIRAAGEGDADKVAGWVKNAYFCRDWPIPEFPVSGKDLGEHGVDSGPQMGKVLRALQQLWIRSGFEADKDKLLTAYAVMFKPKSH